MLERGLHLMSQLITARQRALRLISMLMPVLPTRRKDSQYLKQKASTELPAIWIVKRCSLKAVDVLD